MQTAREFQAQLEAAQQLIDPALGITGVKYVEERENSFVINFTVDAPLPLFPFRPDDGYGLVKKDPGWTSEEIAKTIKGLAVRVRS